MPTIEDLGAEGVGLDVQADAVQIIKPDSLAGLDPDEEDDEDFDETLAERLYGLTEMFPEGLRNMSGTLVTLTYAGVKTAYSLGCSGMWVAASSATILALPIMFETERAQMEEQQMQQQRQLLLGPNAAVSGAGPAQGLMPQVVPPPQR